ncbi:uncharacterized protein LOC113538624 [Tachysurus ichikawai]
MGVEDKLCNELFHWMEKQEECANYLVNLAKELEEMREVMTAGQFVGNTATALGSVALVGTGIATFLTGGLAAPLLVAAASATVGVARILRAMAKRSRRDLPLGRLTRLLTTVDMRGCLRFALSTEFFTTVRILLGILGVSFVKIVGK